MMQTLSVEIERKLEASGLILPAPTSLPAGVQIPFAWVRVRGHRAFISGHGALNTDGSPAAPFGKVPSEVTLEEAQQSATFALLAILSSIKDAVGDLDRVTAWLSISGHVNADPGYPQTTAVINPVSDLILELYGDTVGAHARTAIGVAALPINLPVVIAAEIEID
jgi:enamine deaminase RidA (YjgF/YER057c/UK114 family)